MRCSTFVGPDQLATLRCTQLQQKQKEIEALHKAHEDKIEQLTKTHDAKVEQLTKVGVRSWQPQHSPRHAAWV